MVLVRTRFRRQCFSFPPNFVLAAMLLCHSAFGYLVDEFSASVHGQGLVIPLGLLHGALMSKMLDFNSTCLIFGIQRQRVSKMTQGLYKT